MFYAKERISLLPEKQTTAVDNIVRYRNAHSKPYMTPSDTCFVKKIDVKIVKKRQIIKTVKLYKLRTCMNTVICIFCHCYTALLRAFVAFSSNP